MDELWSSLERWLELKLPEVIADLNPGCSSKELTKLELDLNCRLPEEFKALYKRHDGQKGQTTGLFFGLPFLSIKALYQEWTVWSDLAQEDFATEIIGESYPPGAIKPTYINRKWIPLVSDGGGNHLGVDLDPGFTGVIGQVINFGRDENNKFVLAPSLSSFMSWMLVQYQRGNYQSTERSLAIKEPTNTHFLDIVPLLFGSS